MILSKPVERKELFQLGFKKLLIQFSLDLEHTKLFTLPRCVRFLNQDTIHKRANRKYFEGRESVTLFHKDLPTQLDLTIPDGYVLSLPSCQKREKVCSHTGEVLEYMIFRFTLFSKDKYNDSFTNYHSVQFLESLCSYFWLSRGYVNNFQDDSQSFFSINFEQLMLSQPDQSKSLILTRDAQAILI